MAPVPPGGGHFAVRSPLQGNDPSVVDEKQKHLLERREAPGAAVFFWTAIAAMVIVPVTLMAMAGR